MILPVFGILLSLSVYWLAFPSGATRRPLIFAGLFLVQLAAAYAYYNYPGGKDALTYFADPHRIAERAPLLPGTVFVYKLVQCFRQLGATLLEQFLFFQCFGMIGIAVLIRAVNEMGAKLNRPTPLLFYATLFLPGLHFWTVAPGKDGIVFAGAALAQWATLQPRRRLGWFALAVAAMASMRPHVAGLCILVALIQLGVARPKSKRETVAVVAGVVVLVGLTATTAYILGLQAVDPAAVAAFVELRVDRLVGTSSGNMETLVYPLRLLSFLFRPMFLDTRGFYGLILSFENLALLAIVGFLAWRAHTIVCIMGRLPAAKFAFLFALVLLVALSLVTFNLGAAARQKIMMLPSVLFLLATVLMLHPPVRRKGGSELGGWRDARVSGLAERSPKL